MNDLDLLIADKMALERILKRVVGFIDPKPPKLPVLKLTGEQIIECTAILKEAYRCLWSEHPGKS